MTVPAAAILAILLAHPSWSDRHATDEERLSALEPVAIAIAEASRDRAEAAMLLALGRHESGFAISVVYGACERGQCDGGRARGAWQLHAAACREAYEHDQYDDLRPIKDLWGGYTILVEQVAWGHVARKRTLLYLVGVPYELVQATVRTGGTPTHWVSGGRSPSPRNGKKRYASDAVPPGMKVCSAEQRRRTPTAFAEWLVMLARSSKV